MFLQVWIDNWQKTRVDLNPFIKSQAKDVGQICHVRKRNLFKDRCHMNKSIVLRLVDRKIVVVDIPEMSRGVISELKNLPFWDYHFPQHHLAVTGFVARIRERNLKIFFHSI